MARIQFTDFDAGLVLGRAADLLPPGASRRLRGARAIRTGSLQSRDGSLSIDAPPSTAHSLFRFQDKRYAGVSTTLEEDGVSIQSAFDGTRLSFANMQTENGQRDYLFVAGGGNVAAAAGTETFDTPWCQGGAGTETARLMLQSSNFTATLKTSQDVDGVDTAATDIDYDGTNTPWVGSQADKGYLQSAQFTATLKTSVAWTTIDTGPSGISFDGDNTPWCGNNDDKLYLTSGQFTATIKDSEATSGTTNPAGISFDGDDTPWCGTPGTPTVRKLMLQSAQFTALVKTSQTLTVAASGISWDGANTPIARNIDDRLLLVSGEFTATFKDSQDLTAFSADVEGLSSNSATARGGTGHVLPGQQVKVDSAGAVTRWGIAPPDSGDTVAPADSAAAGLPDGTYKYKFTYKNSTSGAESNPSDESAAVTVVTNKINVVIAAGDLSDDAQVNRIVLYRTVAGGTDFFKVAETTNTAHTFSDNIADSSLGLKVRLDNAPPEATYEDAVGPHQGRMWWTRDSTQGKKNRVYFSPIGRPESAQGGFIDIAADDDDCQKLVIHDRALFCFTEGGIYRIDGTTVPFTFTRVAGIGTIAPFTVISTLVGVLYQAQDGFRVFDGLRSRLAGFDGLGRLNRGETVDGHSPFEGVVATFARGEYLVSDGATTYALDVFTGAWREIPLGLDALYWESESDTILASVKLGGDLVQGAIVDLEAEGVFLDVGERIAFEWQSPSWRSNEGASRQFLQRLELDLATDDEKLLVTLIEDERERPLVEVSTSQRTTVEVPVMRSAGVFAIRLSGSLSRRVEVHRVEAVIRAAGSTLDAA